MRPKRASLDSGTAWYLLHGIFREMIDVSEVQIIVLLVLVSLNEYVWSSQPGKFANPARGQLNREKFIFPRPHTRLRIWSRETGSAFPSRVSLFILHTRAEFGAYSRDSSRFPRRRRYRHTPSGQPRVHRVTQMRTNGVHCRESAGTGLVKPQSSR